MDTWNRGLILTFLWLSCTILLRITLLIPVGLAQARKRIRCGIRMLKQVLDGFAKSYARNHLKVWNTFDRGGLFFSFATLMTSYTSFKKITIIQKAEIDEDVLYTIFPHLLGINIWFSFLNRIFITEGYIKTKSEITKQYYNIHLTCFRVKL